VPCGEKASLTEQQRARSDCGRTWLQLVGAIDLVATVAWHIQRDVFDVAFLRLCERSLLQRQYACTRPVVSLVKAALIRVMLCGRFLTPTLVDGLLKRCAQGLAVQILCIQCSLNQFLHRQTRLKSHHALQNV
jgi:hypothetical protein